MRRALVFVLGMAGTIIVLTSRPSAEEGAGRNNLNGGLTLDVRPRNPKDSDNAWKEDLVSAYLRKNGTLVPEQITAFVKWAVRDRKLRVETLYWLGESFTWLTANQPDGPGYSAQDALGLLKRTSVPAFAPRTFADLADIQAAWRLYVRFSRNRTPPKDSDLVRKLYSVVRFTSVFEEAVKLVERDWEAERIHRLARLTFLRERLRPTDGLSDNRGAPDFDKMVAEIKQLEGSEVEWQKQYSAWRQIYCKYSSDFWITPVQPQMPDEKGNPSIGRVLLPNLRYDVAKMIWGRRPPPWGHHQEIENAQRVICTKEVLTKQESLRQTMVKNYRLTQRYRDLQNLCNSVSRQIESNLGFFTDLASEPAFAGNLPSSEPGTVLLLRTLMTNRDKIRALHRESMRMRRAVGGAGAPDDKTASALKSLHELILVQLASFDSLEFLIDSVLIEPKVLLLMDANQTKEVRANASGQSLKRAALGSETGSFNMRWRTLAGTLVSVAVQAVPDATIVYSVPDNIDFRFKVSVGKAGSMDLIDYVRSLNAQYNVVRAAVSQNYPKWERNIIDRSSLFQQQAAQNFSVATSLLQQRSAQSAAHIKTVSERAIALSMSAKTDYLKQAAIPYEFQRVMEGASLATVPGQPGKDLASLNDKLTQLPNPTPEQAALRECGVVCLASAALAYFKGEAKRGRIYGHVGEAFAHAIIGSDKLKEFSLRLLPQGWVIDAFEAITGKDLDGRELTPLERGLVILAASNRIVGEARLGVEAIQALSRAYSRTAASMSRFAESSGIAKLFRLATRGGNPVKGAKYVRELPELTGSLKEAFFHETIKINGKEVTKYTPILTGEYEPGELLFQAQKAGQKKAGHWFTPAKPVNPAQAEEWTNIEKWGKTADKIVLYRVKERVSGYAGLVDGAKVEGGPQVLLSTGHQFFVPYDVPISEVVEEVRVFTKDRRGFFVP